MLKQLTMTALVTFVALLAMSGLPSPAVAVEEFFAAELKGSSETPVTVSTSGTGLFAAQLNAAETALSFIVVYSGISSAVNASHIHLGRPGITGGVIIPLCGGAKPACPASPGSVTGVVTAADVGAVAAQGIAAGDFAAVIRAMRRGDTYANVHSTTYPGGEIRGAIQ